jgi:tetratricopeptide (TPR) repeat protein
MVTAIPATLEAWLGWDAQTAWLFSVGVGALLLGALLGLWQLVGPAPRRRRACRRAEHLLRQGQWQPALALLQTWLHRGRLSPHWQARLRRLEGECHRAAGEEALKQKKYEDGLERLLKAAQLVAVNEHEVRGYVVETMLAEVRRLLAGKSQADADAVLPLLSRTLLILPSCAEASFWQGLCHIRQGKVEAALSSLLQARGGEGEVAGPATAGKAPAATFIDPPLYLGGLLLREGQADEAVRYLAEANRLDANCPFVTWQLGTAMLAAGGDALIAVKALQRALGPRGLLLWVKHPARAWVEGFPDRRSFVRRLATQYPFHCPLFGSDVSVMVRQGQITLGQGLYRLGNFEESAKIFNQILQESAPSLPVLRGLGLALARLDRFDQAFKHLRTAHEMEEPKNFLTAGYLALCGARGKPTQPEDKLRNVAWAARLVVRFNVRRHPEWAQLLNQIFAEARDLNLPLPVEDQLRLCETLASVDATDPLAGAAYAQLAETMMREAGKGTEPTQAAEGVVASPVTLSPCHPVTLSEFRPEFAWLYCRAAQEHGVRSNYDLDLFALTFATAADARPYFAQRQWDFDEVEFTYLERSAERLPGQFPAALGPDYPGRGAALLLARSHWLEGLQDPEGAAACVETLRKLAPANTQALDRLAHLRYQAGDLEQAARLLGDWHRLAPADPWPLIRQAVIEQLRGNPAGRSEAIRRALELTRGKFRADVAFLGARLALQEWLRSPALGPGETRRNGDAARDALLPVGAGQQLLDLLEQCLHEDPGHEAGLWCRAAVCCLLGDEARLAGQSAAMQRRQEMGEVGDARFHFLAAVCHLAAGDYGLAVAAADRTANEKALAAEAGYLKGWAALLRNDRPGAAAALQQAAADPETPAHAHAQALLGKICFDQGALDEAVAWWKALEPARRTEWQLDEPLRSTLFAGALQAFAEGRFEPAATQIREAGRLGLRDRRLGPLLTLALIKAGQRALYASGER